MVALVALVGANGAPSFEGTVTLILCNLIIVLGLQVFIGNSGVYSFGQLGFATAGAYVAALLTLPAAIALLQTPGLPDLVADAQLGPLLATSDRRGGLRPARARGRAAADADLDPGDPDLDLRLPDRRLQRGRQLGSR